jgi:PAS domain S-box-containing protein
LKNISKPFTWLAVALAAAGALACVSLVTVQPKLAALMILLVLVAVFMVFWAFDRAQQREKALAHLETKRLLAAQEDSYRQLQQANRLAQEVAQKLAVTLDSIGDAVIATDAQARVSLLNPVAQKLTGWTLAQALGQPVEQVFRIVSKASGEPLAVPVLAALAHGTVQGLANHTLLMARDGAQYDIADSCSPIRDADGVVVGAVLVFRNVTEEYATRRTVEAERERLDQALRDKNTELEAARATADKANLAKSEFLSSMSHELRSPLNAILGFAQLMESGAPAPTPSQKASIEQILRAGWYLLELINEVLDLALIESGRLSLSREPVSLPEVLQDCQTLMAPLALKKEVQLHFAELATPCFVSADRTRLKQVVINLLSNAIKYNRAGGSVTVSCSERACGRIRLSVQDTGEGLAPELLMQLFQPFNRLGREGSEEEGTGIGLVVSKRLVEQMGGEIGVISTMGAGSVFWVELERIAAPQFSDVAVEMLLSHTTPMVNGERLRTLLYVEDNRANMELVRQLIARRPDMRLFGAEDAMRGMALAREHQPDVILLDINLPGINGLQALKILQEDRATRHIPVLALSANAMPSDIERGLAAGFLRYMTKPIRIAEFMDALDVGLALAQKRRAAGLGREVLDAR